jgi:hypothetical protein
MAPLCRSLAFIGALLFRPDLTHVQRTIEQKVNGTLPLADGEGSAGDPASESRLDLLLLFCVSAETRRSSMVRFRISGAFA